jgi:hypothetical protein
MEQFHNGNIVKLKIKTRSGPAENGLKITAGIVQ